MTPYVSNGDGTFTLKPGQIVEAHPYTVRTADFTLLACADVHPDS